MDALLGLKSTLDQKVRHLRAVMHGTASADKGRFPVGGEVAANPPAGEASTSSSQQPPQPPGSRSSQLVGRTGSQPFRRPGTASVVLAPSPSGGSVAPTPGRKPQQKPPGPGADRPVGEMPSSASKGFSGGAGRITYAPRAGDGGGTADAASAVIAGGGGEGGGDGAGGASSAGGGGGAPLSRRQQAAAAAPRKG